MKLCFGVVIRNKKIDKVQDNLSDSTRFKLTIGSEARH